MMRLSGWIILLQTSLIKQIFFDKKVFLSSHAHSFGVFFSTPLFDHSGITILITIGFVERHVK